MFRKFLSVILAASQLAIVPHFSAAYASPSSFLPETSLLQTVVTLKGLRLSRADFNSQIDAALERYLKTAPADGREARLQTALVDLGILTRQQARRFAAEAELSSAQLSAEPLTSEQAELKKFHAQVTRVARTGMDGAQFSSCGGSRTMWGSLLAIGGLIAVFEGVAQQSENPTCHSDPASAYPCTLSDCYYDEYDNYECYDYDSTCYKTVCDQPDYYPYRERGRKIAIGGGIAIAAGIVLIVSGANCE